MLFNGFGWVWVALQMLSLKRYSTFEMGLMVVDDL